MVSKTLVSTFRILTRGKVRSAIHHCSSSDRDNRICFSINYCGSFAYLVCGVNLRRRGGAERATFHAKFSSLLR
ncbi:unnamed protein product [Callosobruchus maculatus]|nr:unnamed protein product [Callosobruchus maculatus]